LRDRQEFLGIDENFAEEGNVVRVQPRYGGNRRNAGRPVHDLPRREKALRPSRKTACRLRESAAVVQSSPGSGNAGASLLEMRRRSARAGAFEAKSGDPWQDATDSG
jgi:hypothetical protein